MKDSHQTKQMPNKFRLWLDSLIVTLSFSLIGLWIESQDEHFPIIEWKERAPALDMFYIFFFTWGGWIFFIPAIFCCIRSKSIPCLLSMYLASIIFFGGGDGLISFPKISFWHILGGIAHSAVIFLPVLIFSLLAMLLAKKLNERINHGRS